MKRFNMGKNDWENLNVLQIGRLAPRSFYTTYASKEEALKFNRHNAKAYHNLNGEWRFCYSKTPWHFPKDYMNHTFDDSVWDVIDVPSEWQFKGYDAHHYTDAIAIFPILDDPRIPVENPTGIYRKHIEITSEQLQKQIILRFDGVESAFHLWVNGEEVGYSQGSRLTSEFDISSYLVEGENSLVVKVYKFCEGSYIENQDMWWLSGIFREVSLIERPRFQIKDYTIRTAKNPLSKVWEVKASVVISNLNENKIQGTIKLTLEDEEHTFSKLISQELVVGEKDEVVVNIAFEMEDPKLWSAECPYLYNLIINLQGENIDEYIATKVGLREVELKNGLMLINGKPIKFKGVNRHDWCCESGRTVTYEWMEEEIVMMKKHNINAVRTAHYPNHPDFYHLCDKYGLYVIEEADIECDQLGYIKDRDRISDDVRWQQSYLDRVSRMVLRDKNHPSIVMWSLGNESGYGCNFKTCYTWCKQNDPTRLVHYEEDRYAETADVLSSMYTTHEKLEELGVAQLDKPHIVCEYAHAMGNGPGGLKEYWDVFYRHERLQGGFVWEWIEHGILQKDKADKSYFAYGGDFGDDPNGKNFCTDGLIQGDHKPTPGLTELKKVLEPIKIELEMTQPLTLNVRNLYDFIDLSFVTLEWKVWCEDTVVAQKQVKLPAILPGESERIILIDSLTQLIDQRADKEYWLDIKVYGEEVLEAKEAISTYQFKLQLEYRTKKRVKRVPQPQLKVEDDDYTLQIMGQGWQTTIDKFTGKLVSYCVGEKEYIENPFKLELWRAPLDNDIKQVAQWKLHYIHILKEIVNQVSVQETSDKVIVTVDGIVAPILVNWSIDFKYTYTILATGEVELSYEGVPKGKLPESFPRVGIHMGIDKDLERVMWYGKGPGESYIDSQEAQIIGIYEKTIQELQENYVKPQENGNRSHVKWMEFTNNNNKGLLFVFPRKTNFGASYYTIQQLENARHTVDLKEDDVIHLRIDEKVHGLGSASWGPNPLPQHMANTRPFKIQFVMTTTENTIKACFDTTRQICEQFEYDFCTL